MTWLMQYLVYGPKTIPLNYTINYGIRRDTIGFEKIVDWAPDISKSKIEDCDDANYSSASFVDLPK